MCQVWGLTRKCNQLSCVAHVRDLEVHPAKGSISKGMVSLDTVNLGEGGKSLTDRWRIEAMQRGKKDKHLKNSALARIAVTYIR